jgi:hypothetical protein
VLYTVRDIVEIVVKLEVLEFVEEGKVGAFFTFICLIF